MSIQLGLEGIKPDQRPKSTASRTMFVDDAGEGMIKWVCDSCGFDEGWKPCASATRSVNQNEKGRVCPKCKGYTK